MPVPIAIRGIGLITPLGVDAKSSWQAILASQYIATHARCSLAPSPGIPRQGWGGGSSPTDVDSDKFELSGIARIHCLARHAAEEAVASANWSAEVLADERTALVVATSKGPADHWIENANTPPPFEKLGSDNPAGRMPISFGLSEVCDVLARGLRHGFGPRLTLSGACASGLHALIRAAMLIEQGDADRALVVAAESSLHPLFQQSFKRLGVLVPDGQRCRPFDVNRNGFLCAEAAAAVVIEPAADPRPGDVLIDRYAFAGDGAHLTSSDPSGSTLRRLLVHALDGRRVDVIHAHGTGTQMNDAAEAAAIDGALQTSVGGSRPAIYSHKGAIGHTLGAAGLAAVAMNVLMHRDGIVPPNVGIETPMRFEHADIQRAEVRRTIDRSIISAAGFGGATAAVSLTHCVRR